MTSSFLLDYFLLVFLAACGLFQVIAANRNLRGMLFFQHRPGSLMLGLALVAASFTWFFLSEPRNVPDSALGLNGNEQFAYFFAGLGTALVFTLIVSSLTNWTLGAGRTQLPNGLDALRESTYLRAMYLAYRRWRVRSPEPSGTSVDRPTADQ